ncbi:box C/D snoRNA protein 1 isoform X2 [Ascaphus truei]|uniref:box C/D snoRNA protein 1 isoform X2 n=1 Tax=Ascaphus truei TaxID=8439 RepID=UPI003F59D579
MEALPVSGGGTGDDTGVTAARCRKRKMSLNICETCGSDEAKYRCPRCMKYSCSLSCVKQHKTDVRCDGIRDKAAFVSISNFNEINLLSDYRLLEDAGRSADCAGRDLVLQWPTSNKFLNYLKNRGRRHAIDLKILPIGFTKRRENSTFFNKKVPDSKTLHEILKAYIDPAESDPVIRQRLKAYVMCQSDVKVFMKVEQRQHSSIRYYELDSSKSLLENLKNKTIIEYPTLHVVLKEFMNDIAVFGQELGPSAPVSCPGEEPEEGEIRGRS